MAQDKLSQLHGRGSVTFSKLDLLQLFSTQNPNLSRSFRDRCLPPDVLGRAPSLLCKGVGFLPCLGGKRSGNGILSCKEGLALGDFLGQLGKGARQTLAYTC